MRIWHIAAMTAFLAMGAGAAPAQEADAFPDASTRDFTQQVQETEIYACMKLVTKLRKLPLDLQSCSCGVDVVDAKMTLNEFLIAKGTVKASVAQRRAALSLLSAALAEAKEICI